MQFLSRTRLVVGFLVAVALLATPAVQAQGKQKKKGESKDVSFETYDGVKISGTLYPSAGGKRDAVVMLLHTFDPKKGGSSQQPGWADLAATLQKEGFTVLSFDFRGFGESKTLASPNLFWKQTANMNLIKHGPKLPDQIEHNKFTPGYYRYLVNDIAAAKAYLDRRNDAKELNSSNVIVIGAGEGATLGAMWLANECRRKRDKVVPPAAFGPPTLAEQPEISDIACGIWLTISSKLGGPNGINVGNSLNRWITEAGKKHKVPMAFIYGKGDASGGTIAKHYEGLIKASAKPKEFKTTGVYGVPGTKLAGNLLLDKDLKTEEWMLKTYLIENVLEVRGSKEQKNRQSEASAYWYVLPTKRWLNKKAGQESPPVDVSSLQ